MILVTGAAGKTGRAVVRALVSGGHSVRALVFREEQVEPLTHLGAADITVGDMCDPSAVSAAMRGTDAVYFICPNMHPDEHAIGLAAIDAASHTGVGRFVYHSVLLPAVEEMPHHWQKHLVEMELVASGLEHVILRPCAYMQNVLPRWSEIVDRGEYAVPYSVETRLSIVDLRDVAEAAAGALSAPGLEGDAYDLCGPEALSQEDVASILTDALRTPVRASVVASDEWELGARTAGLSDYAIESLLMMFDYYQRNDFCGSSTRLEELLGRPATTFMGFVRRSCSGADQD